MLMTVSEHLRAHLLESLGVVSHRVVADLDDLRERRWNSRFEQMMRGRLIMGAFRYECEDLDGYRRPRKFFDNVPSMRQRLDAYEESGDLEHLVDVANLCMIEFRASRHPKRHLGAGYDHGHHTTEKI